MNKAKAKIADILVDGKPYSQSQESPALDHAKKVMAAKKGGHDPAPVVTHPPVVPNSHGMVAPQLLPKPGSQTAKKAEKASIRAASAEIKAAAPRTETVSGVMRGMIIEGKSNSEIWESCKVRFGLGDEKKGYPGWYRSQLRRQGKLDAVVYPDPSIGA